MKTIGITGGSGFIGSYVTKMFLEKDYKVKISVTDIDKKDKYQHLMKFDNSDNLEITTLNVNEITQLKEFATDCEILVHCGTPFQLEFEDPQKELLDPTIKGTENLLRVISDIPSVKKVVLIASVAAYNTGYPMRGGPHRSALTADGETRHCCPRAKNRISRCHASQQIPPRDRQKRHLFPLEGHNWVEAPEPPSAGW